MSRKNKNRGLNRIKFQRLKNIANILIYNNKEKYSCFYGEKSLFKRVFESFYPRVDINS